jgi:hypothetical protein
MLDRIQACPASLTMSEKPPEGSLGGKGVGGRLLWERLKVACMCQWRFRLESDGKLYLEKVHTSASSRMSSPEATV